MFSKTLIATTVAALLAAGSLALTATNASAAFYGAAYGHVAGSGWHAGRGIRKPLRRPAVHRLCRKTYKTVRAWTPHYAWVWATVHTGKKCWFEPVYGPY